MLTVFSMPAKPGDNEFSSLFHFGKQLTFQRAFFSLRDEQASEDLVEDVMVLASDRRRSIRSMDDFQKKSFFLVLTEICLDRTTKGRDPAGVRTLTMPYIAELSKSGSDEIQTRLDRIDKLSMKDLTILTLSSIHSLSFDQIASLLKVKVKTVIKRFRRANRFLNSGTGDYLERPDNNGKLQATTEKALLLYQQQKLQRLEGLSEDHERMFSTDFENRVVQEMAGSVSFLANFKKRPVLIVAASLFSILLLILLFRRFSSSVEKEPKIEEESGSIIASEAETEKMAGYEFRPAQVSEEEPNFTKTRIVPADHYASYQKTTIFLDPDTLDLYDLTEGKSPKKVMNLAAVAEENSGIQYIGKIDNRYYLAFINGKGAEIQGVPFKLELMPYWQEYWFDHQIKLDGKLESGIVIEEVRYQFERERPEANE